MKQFEEDLAAILQDDPLGLLVVKPKQSATVTSDQRLVASFSEITEFFRVHGREPEKSPDIQERRLYSRLKGLRESPQRAFAIKEYDEFNLLGEVTVADPAAIETIDDVLGGDILGLLGDAPSEGDPEDIFVLRNVPEVQSKPDYVAKRKACAEFDQFEPLFKHVHAQLKTCLLYTSPSPRD